MIGLFQLLNSGHVKGVVPPFLKNMMVSYSYFKTLSGGIFNHRTVVEELDIDGGTEGIVVIVMHLRDM